MKKVCVLTATRAEYGLLKPVIDELGKYPDIEVNVAVTGAHLSPEYGLTYKLIEEDGVRIDTKIDMNLDSDTPLSISKSMGKELCGFAEYFAASKPDLLMVLGDRYEIVPAVLAAVNENVPVAHIHGGEQGAGTVDNMIRHAVTKFSSLHFTSTEVYRKRVIQLGELPDTVYNVGALGVENIKKLKLLDKKDIEKELDFKLDDNTIMVTFHPLSLYENTAKEQFEVLLSSFEEMKDLRIIFTKANADSGGRIINKMINEFAEKNPDRVKVFFSLGTIRYLSALKYVKASVGNSSSGIIEAPSVGIYSLDIGTRQRGRMCSDSVYHCDVNKEEIISNLTNIINLERKQFENPYEKTGTSQNIAAITSEYLKKGFRMDKTFFDLEVDV